DNATEAVASDHDFIWYTFTRFEPAGDIYSNYNVVKNHVVQNPPIVIDASLKTWFPPTTDPDPKTVELVDKKFGHIFK
ncbi:MAG: hypothetical protein JJT78_13780, partial [Leptospira sp.]|nr:hypothetical protein [Leptospira sp.]